MTAGGLEKTMALLQLRPARLVAQGLAPKDLLKDDSAPDADADSSSGSEVEPEQSDSQLSDHSQQRYRERQHRHAGRHRGRSQQASNPRGLCRHRCRSPAP
ncbi:unnamed protein product [Ectocarpus sp. 12 AP-2014]